jgi:glycosyltransferase involved in cell wall biosynthesis
MPLLKIENCKIVMVHQSLEMGGAERQGLLFALWLKEIKNIDIEVWGFGNQGAVAKWCEEHQLPWRLVPYNFYGTRVEKIAGLFRLWWAFMSVRPVVLLPYTMPANIACGLLWRVVGAKSCIWNQRDEGRQRESRFIEKYAVRNTPHFISNSCHAADFITQDLGVHSDQVHVIHNGISLPPRKLEREEWRTLYKIPKEAFVACMVANLHEYKDHPTLIKAWQLVIKGCDSMHHSPVLLLAGHDYGRAKELKAMVDEHGLNRHIHFLGHVEDIAGLLSASDIGVFSSLKEGVPNGVLECMAAGLPVVATDIPGIREALGSENEDFLIKPEDASAMADSILRIISNEKLRKSIIKTNIKRIYTEFTKEQMCERTYKVIINSLK